MKTQSIAAVVAALAVAWPSAAPAQEEVGASPWGPTDERGRLNLMTNASRAAVLSRIAGGHVYDLSVDYFIGMPGWHVAGDPRYQMWMTHTPLGNVVSDPMYSHTGTHIDALNHFGLNGRIYNGFTADEHLGDQGWKKTGAETIPPLSPGAS